MLGLRSDRTPHSPGPPIVSTSTRLGGWRAHAGGVGDLSLVAPVAPRAMGGDATARAPRRRADRGSRNEAHRELTTPRSHVACLCHQESVPEERRWGGYRVPCVVQDPFRLRDARRTPGGEVRRAGGKSRGSCASCVGRDGLWTSSGTAGRPGCVARTADGGTRSPCRTPPARPACR